MGFIKKIPFISKINRHIICFFDRTLLFYQWMLFIVHAGEMKECELITSDVFAFFPYHAVLYPDGWFKGNTGNTGTGKFICHAGIKKASVFPGFYKLQGGVDLAAPHNNIWFVAVHLKTLIQKLILDRVLVKKYQVFF